jgi:hypothetical protein
MPVDLCIFFISRDVRELGLGITRYNVYLQWNILNIFYIFSNAEMGNYFGWKSVHPLRYEIYGPHIFRNIKLCKRYIPASHLRIIKLNVIYIFWPDLDPVKKNDFLNAKFLFLITTTKLNLQCKFKQEFYSLTNFLFNARDLTSSTGSKVSSRRLCLHLLHWQVILGSACTTLHHCYAWCRSKILLILTWKEVKNHYLQIPEYISIAPWYVTNTTLHTDMVIPTIQEVIYGRSTKHRARLQSHSKPLLQSLSRDTVLRRLKRRWPADL